MQFTIKKTVLQEELSRIQSLLQVKTTIPVLDSVYIKSDGPRLVVTATNMDNTLTSVIAADNIAEPGAVCVQARRFLDRVRLMPEGLCDFRSTDGGWLEIRGGQVFFKVSGFPPENYPSVPAPAEDTEWLEVPAKDFGTLINGVDFSIAPEEDSRYMLQSAKIEIDGAGIRMISTDGHRLSMATGALDVLLMEDLDVLLPRKGVEELSRLIADAPGKIGIAREANHIFFRAGGRTLASRLSVGDFANYEMVLSTVAGFDLFSTFRATNLAQSIKRALLVAEGKTATVSMLFGEGKLKLEANHPDAGELSEGVDCNFNGEDPVKIWVNARFVLDFLTAAGANDVIFEVKGRDHPLHMKTKKDGIDYRNILMTLNVPE